MPKSLDVVLERLHVKKTGVKTGEGHTALCPAHDDKTASLSIRHTGGKVLLHCHAGCTTESIMAALGLPMSALFDESRPGTPEPRAKAAGRIVEVYDYTDPAGVLLYQVCRLDPKNFKQRRPDGAGGFTWNMQGVTRVLYRLVQVNAAIAEGLPIFIVEGEKDCHSLESIGLVATCNAGGAGKWQPEFSDTLKGASVIILPDNDEPGRKHGEQVAQSLQGKAASVRVVNLPDLQPKGDVSDWLSAGGTKEEFLNAVEKAPEWTLTAPALVLSLMDTLTDLGNAERLIALHGENLRFDVDCDKWLVWNGRLWARDETGEVHRLACEVVRAMYVLLADVSDKEDVQKLYSFIKRSQSAERLAAMVKLSQFRPGIPVRSSELDSDPWLLNCENGTVDLTTGTLRPHRQTDLCTKLAPVKYDPASECPRWMRFLEEVFGDEELVGFVRRMSGYSLTGDTREQAFFLLVGKGSNGKGIFTNTLAAVLGDYAKDTPVTTFLDKRGEQSNDLASLAGSRLVGASEGEDTSSFNESLIKRLTGQDNLTARFLRQEFFTYKPTFKILFATNEVPRLKTQNYAMRRRVKLIPFRQRFYYSHEQKAPVRDEGLAGKLYAEASGILAWAVRGCLEWQKTGLGMPATMQDEVNSLFENMDVLAEFIEECCIKHPGAKVESGALWRVYLAWCEQEGRPPAFNQPGKFAQNLCARDGIEAKRGSNGGPRYLTGIGLLEDNSPSTVTASDGYSPFSGNSLMREKQAIEPENAILPTLADTVPRESPPTADCSNCGKREFYWQNMANNGNGAWVCRHCKTARQQAA